MADTVRAEPTESRITHDLKLSDGITNLGLIMCNSRGIPIHGGEPWSLRQSGTTRTSLQINQGDSDYSDYQLPYTPFTQKDWSGGRGNEDFEKDQTRYFDGTGLNTRMGDIILEGKPTSSTFSGTTTTVLSLPVGYAESVATTSSQRYASQYVTTNAVTFSSIMVRVHPGANVTVEVIKDDSGSPSASAGDIVASESAWVAGYELTTSTIGAGLGEAQFGVNELGHGINVENSNEVVSKTVYIKGSLEASTTYWVVVTTDYIGYGTTTAGNYIKNETSPNTWNELHSGKAIYYKLRTSVQGKVELFTYKGGLYAVMKNDDETSSSLYLNGYRFVAGSGSSQSRIYYDAGLGITAGELEGCILQCVGGRGYQEDPNYRVITSNTTTYLEFEDNLLLTPNNTTEYVILGTDTWNEITGCGFTASVTDICVANEICYFAQGENTIIRRMREYNNAGTWTREFAADGANKGTFLELMPVHSGTYKVWKFNNPTTGGPTATYADLEEWGTDLDFATSPFDAVLNGGFESAGSGSPDIFGTWVEGVSTGSTVAAETTNIHGGDKSAKLTTGSGGDVSVAQDISVFPGYKYKLSFWVKGDGATNIPQYSVHDNDNSKYIIAKKDLPGTASASWRKINQSFTVPRDCYEAKVTIYGSATNGAVCYIDDVSVVPTVILNTEGIYETATEYPIPIGDARSKITNVLGYGDPMIPWVIKEDEFGSIANNVYATVPISEMRYVKNAANGKAAIQFGVYLFISLLEGLERFYDNRFDDIGPNLDEGLPNNRRGNISCISSYPGGLYLGIDAGVAGYSSVLFWNQVGYHEVYRADIGQRVRSLQIQTFPDGRASKLWIGLSSKTVWIPVCLNPRQQTDYRYTSTGSLESSWFNGGFKEINKFWKSVQVFAENLTSGQTITMKYMTDTDTEWHDLPDTYDTSPMQEVLMANDYSVYGKRWKYKITLATTDDMLTPRVKAVTIPSVTRLPPNKAWSMTVLADDALVDRQGNKQTLSAKELLDQLDKWADSAQTPAPLTMRSPVSALDNHMVFIESPTMQPVEVMNGNVKSLKAIISLSVYEA